jgi:hypothetical protein
MGCTSCDRQRYILIGHRCIGETAITTARLCRRVPYDANHTTVSRWLEGTVAREVRPGHRWLVHEPVSFQDEATCILQWEQEVGGVSAETQLQARLGHS